MIRFACLFFAALLGTPFGFAQQVEKIRLDAETVAVVHSPWELIPIKTNATLRGLCVMNDAEIWASGTRGTVVHSYDNGRSWRVNQIQGAAKLDLRDVHAIDEGTAVVLSAGSPARIYRTTNGGSAWKLCYENDHPKVFFNSLTFWDKRLGVAMSDPIDGRLVLIGTTDGGRTWKELPASRMPKLTSGEAAFAASGTNMATYGDKGIVVALANGNQSSGSLTSRLLFSPNRGRTWTSSTTPLKTSKTAGVFSVCFLNEKEGCVVGGDYRQPDETSNNYSVTNDGGKTWATPSPRVPPSGYRSCVAKLAHGKEVYLVSVGSNGTDLSSDLGNKWRRISNVGFHAVHFSPSGRSGWASGSKGKIARWIGAKPVAKSAQK